jgi:hypothetical protein
MKFSQRQGLVPVRRVLQTTELTDELRNTLWNVLLVYMKNRPQFLRAPYGMRAQIYSLGQYLWTNHLKAPVDEIPSDEDIALGEESDPGKHLVRGLRRD